MISARQVVFLGLENYSGETLDIELHDSVSRLLKRTRVVQAAGAPLKMNLAELPNGVYYITVYSGDGQPISRKLVIARNLRVWSDSTVDHIQGFP